MNFLLTSIFSSLALIVNAQATYNIFVTGAGSDAVLRVDTAGYGQRGDAHYALVGGLDNIEANYAQYYFFFPASSQGPGGINSTFNSLYGRVADQDRGELLFYPQNETVRYAPVSNALQQDTVLLNWNILSQGSIIASKNGGSPYAFFACSNFLSTYDNVTVSRVLVVLPPGTTAAPTDCVPVGLSINPPAQSSAASSISAPAGTVTGLASLGTAGATATGMYTNTSTVPSIVGITPIIQGTPTPTVVGITPIMQGTTSEPQQTVSGYAPVGIASGPIQSQTGSPSATGVSPGTAVGSPSTPTTGTGTAIGTGTGTGTGSGTGATGATGGGSTPQAPGAGSPGTGGNGPSTMTTLVVATAGVPTQTSSSVTGLPVQSTSGAVQQSMVPAVSLIVAVGLVVLNTL